ncbi:hypothetical protein P9112_010035 [Eukaryota sp. TZLM1-RC]
MSAKTPQYRTPENRKGAVRRNSVRSSIEKKASQLTEQLDCSVDLRIIQHNDQWDFTYHYLGRPGQPVLLKNNKPIISQLSTLTRPTAQEKPFFRSRSLNVALHEKQDRHGFRSLLRDYKGKAQHLKTDQVLPSFWLQIISYSYTAHTPFTLLDSNSWQMLKLDPAPWTRDHGKFYFNKLNTGPIVFPRFIGPESLDHELGHWVLFIVLKTEKKTNGHCDKDF